VKAEDLAWRAEALFCSPLQPSEHPSPEVIQAAIVEAVLGWRLALCAPCVAQEFGDHPEQAVARMRWARSAVRFAFEMELAR
jgi:hypothetical protein